MSVIDNPSAVKRRDMEVRVNERREISDLMYVMSSSQGRRMMNGLLKRCGVGRLSYAGSGKSEQTAFHEGMRNIGNYYWARLTKNLKKEWLLMVEEAEKEEEIQNARSDDSLASTVQNGREDR